MAELLVVHHSPTPHLTRLTEAVLAGANHPDIQGVDVRAVPALEASSDDVLGAGGYLLGTPANLGYMSGALKHFFDSVYRDCLERTERRPWGLWVHGETDTTGARLAVERIVTGLQWRGSGRPAGVDRVPAGRGGPLLRAGSGGGRNRRRLMSVWADSRRQVCCARASRPRAMTSFWISLVPSPITISGASR